MVGTPAKTSGGLEVKPLPKHWADATKKMLEAVNEWMEVVLGDFNELTKVKIRYDGRERAWIIELWAHDLLLQKIKKVIYKYEPAEGF